MLCNISARNIMEIVSVTLEIELCFISGSCRVLFMNTYTTFKMTLQDRRGTEFETGEPIYWVIVSSDSHRVDSIRCGGNSVRSAFDEAVSVIQSFIDRTCGDCGDITPEFDESMRNCGICLPCYDRMMVKK